MGMGWAAASGAAGCDLGLEGPHCSPHLPLRPGNSPALKNVPEQEVSLAKGWNLLFFLDFLGRAVKVRCCLQTQALGTGSGISCFRVPHP